jgi:hypothetical protein
LNVNRSIAKEIIKLRIKLGALDEKSLGSIKGVGVKTIARAKEVFDFEEIG